MSGSGLDHTDLDPVTFEVLRNGFEQAADRMSTVLQRTSFSPIIYDMVDFSNAVFDPDGELVGQTANCPVHLAAMHFSVEAIVDAFDPEAMGARDVFVLNDPYEGAHQRHHVRRTRVRRERRAHRLRREPGPLDRPRGRRARRDYGVVDPETGEVDGDATAGLRGDP